MLADLASLHVILLYFADCVYKLKVCSNPVSGKSIGAIFLKAFASFLSLLHVEGFSGGSAGQESACNTGDLDSSPGWGRSPEEGTEGHLGPRASFLLKITSE